MYGSGEQDIPLLDAESTCLKAEFQICIAKVVVYIGVLSILE